MLSVSLHMYLSIYTNTPPSRQSVLYYIPNRLGVFQSAFKTTGMA